MTTPPGESGSNDSRVPSPATAKMDTDDGDNSIELILIPGRASDVGPGVRATRSGDKPCRAGSVW